MTYFSVTTVFFFNPADAKPLHIFFFTYYKAIMERVTQRLINDIHEKILLVLKEVSSNMK